MTAGGYFYGPDIVKAIEVNGGMHMLHEPVPGVLNGALCEYYGNNSMDGEVAVTNLVERVTCHFCLEWMQDD